MIRFISITDHNVFFPGGVDFYLYLYLQFSIFFSQFSVVAFNARSALSSEKLPALTRRWSDTVDEDKSTYI